MNTRGIRCTLWALGAATPLFAAELRLKLESVAPAVLSWESAAGFDYRVEVASRLLDPDWQPLAPAQAGTGVRLRVTDSAAVAGSRFYRLIRSEPAGPQISPQAVEAETGSPSSGVGWDSRMQAKVSRASRFAVRRSFIPAAGRWPLSGCSPSPTGR